MSGGHIALAVGGGIVGLYLLSKVVAGGATATSTTGVASGVPAGVVPGSSTGTGTSGAAHPSKTATAAVNTFKPDLSTLAFGAGGVAYKGVVNLIHLL
jgi:hypothetical protein